MTDLTRTQWTFVDNLVSLNNSFTFNFDFVSGNDEVFEKITYEPDMGLVYDSKLVYTIVDGVGTWVDEKYKTIFIVSGEDVENAEAISILKGMTTERNTTYIVKGKYRWNDVLTTTDKLLSYYNFKVNKKFYEGPVNVDWAGDYFGIAAVVNGQGFYLHEVGWLDGSITLNQLLTGKTPVQSDILQTWDFGDGVELGEAEYNYLMSNAVKVDDEPVIPDESDEPVIPDLTYKTPDEFFKAIGDAIRTKKGTTNKINKQNIPNEILSISGGIQAVSTEEEMNALLVEENVGKVYRFTGVSSVYNTGDLYEVVNE